MAAVTTRFEDDILFVTINEPRLDHQDKARQMGQELVNVLSLASGKKVLLDFHKVTFISSAMVGQLFLLNSKCKAEHISLKMCNVAEDIQEVFEIVKLNDFVPIVADEAEARQAFASEAAGGSAAAEVDVGELRRRAEQGDPAAQYELARCYETGCGVELDAQAALHWYRRAAEAGHRDAQHHIAVAYAYGIAVEQDYDEAVRWYRLAAEQGQVEAQYALGMSYRYGIALPEDNEAAAQWYAKAAAQGHEKAQEELQRLRDEAGASD